MSVAILALKKAGTTLWFFSELCANLQNIRLSVHAVNYIRGQTKQLGL